MSHFTSLFIFANITTPDSQIVTTTLSNPTNLAFFQIFRPPNRQIVAKSIVHHVRVIESVYYHANLWSILGIKWMKTRESTPTPRGCERDTCVKSSVVRGPGPVVRRCSYHCQIQCPDDPLPTPPTVCRSTSTPPPPVCSFVSYILMTWITPHLLHLKENMWPT